MCDALPTSLPSACARSRPHAPRRVDRLPATRTAQTVNQIPDSLRFSLTMRIISLCLALACTLTASTAEVAERSLVIEDFSVDLYVNPDGSLNLTESIRCRFEGPWNGLKRFIPVDALTPYSYRRKLRLEVQAVTDDQGRVLSHGSVSRKGHLGLQIAIPDAVDTTRTVILSYRVGNGLRFFDSSDELYWNVTGNDWEVPIEKARITIHLPIGVGGVTATSFTGLRGEGNSMAVSETIGNDVIFQTTQPLGSREGLTIAVAWSTGKVARPGFFGRMGTFSRDNPVLLLPFAVLAVLMAMWHRWGRDPRRRVVKVRFEPPPGLTPAEAGSLMRNWMDLREFTATMIDLAVRGFVRISEEEREGSLFGRVRKPDYILFLLKPQQEWDGLAVFERNLLLALFNPKADYLKISTKAPPAELSTDPATGRCLRLTMRISELRGGFRSRLGEVEGLLFDRLLEKGYYRQRPERWKNGCFTVGGLVLIFGLNGFRAENAPISLPLALSVSGVLIGLFGFLMPARTRAGTRVLEHLLGFKEFLNRAGTESFESVTLTFELFERYLPFAMVFGVEKRWADAFEGVHAVPPVWWVPARIHPFMMGLFVMAVLEMAKDTQAAIAGQGSSGDSGFSGGSSGGGFGGGGGGGY